MCCCYGTVTTYDPCSMSGRFEPTFALTFDSGANNIACGCESEVTGGQPASARSCDLDP